MQCNMFINWCLSHKTYKINNNGTARGLAHACALYLKDDVMMWYVIQASCTEHYTILEQPAVDIANLRDCRY